jgi:hypothetical protein
MFILILAVVARHGAGPRVPREGRGRARAPRRPHPLRRPRRLGDHAPLPGAVRPRRLRHGARRRADTASSRSLDDIRGKTPEELNKILKVTRRAPAVLHQTDEGELRDLDDAEQAAFDLMTIRDAIFEKLENHSKIAEVLRKRPESVKKVYDTSPAVSTTTTASCG